MSDVIVAWSSGKDSAWALWQVRQKGEHDVKAILTTVTDTFGRVSMHGVREEILDRQSEVLGLPCIKVGIPSPCTDEIYGQKMGAALQEVRQRGIEHVVFGDLFLEDVRAYREGNLAAVGMNALFPLWGIETRSLADQMHEGGIESVITCVDPSKLDASFAGRRWNAELVEALPEEVDPCGENGEFHSLVTSGPMFRQPLSVEVGEVVTRDGFVFADVMPASRTVL